MVLGLETTAGVEIAGASVVASCFKVVCCCCGCVGGVVAASVDVVVVAGCWAS